MAAITAAYDLLVTGAPLERGLKGLLETPKDSLTEQAACSVLRLQTPHETMHQILHLGDGHLRFDFADRVQTECLEARLELSSKNALFAHIAGSFAGTTGLAQVEILEALWSREKTQNTSVGHGVALPHATLSGLDRSSLGIFTVVRAIDYQAPDQHPVDVFFATLGPPSDRETHLLLLAKVSRLILHTTLLEELRSATSSEEIAAAVARNTKLLEE
jgi:PTS system nitrogen regulatory IIA component